MFVCLTYKTTEIPGMIKQGVFGFLLVLISCVPSSQDEGFKSFLKSFHHARAEHLPLMEAKPGFTDSPTLLSIPSRTNHDATLRFCKKYLDTLESFDTTRLSVPLQFEYQKIKPLLTGFIHDLETLKIHETDPTFYDLRKYFLPLGDASATNHLDILESNLGKVPEFYSAAIENLKTPDWSKLQEAVQQQAELYLFFEKQIPKLFRLSDVESDEFRRLEQLTFQAQLSIKDFIAFCKSNEFEFFNEAINAVPADGGKKQFEKLLMKEK